MAKITDFIKCNVEIVTKKELETSLKALNNEDKVMREIIEDKCGLAESRIDGLHSHLIKLSNQIKLLERLVGNQTRGGNHG